MKRISKFPYIDNLFYHYRFNMGPVFSKREYGIVQYHDWLRQFGFEVPIKGQYLEFPDDFPDKKITMFVLKWG